MSSRSRTSRTRCSALLASWDLSPTGFLIVVNILLLLLGCVLEGTTILLVIVPVFIPTAQALGIDLVHFGVVVRGQHHAGPDHAALWPAALHHDQHRRACRCGTSCATCCRSSYAMIAARCCHHLLPGHRAVAAPPVRLPGSETDDEADLRPQRPQPQPARQARAGDLRHHDAGRDRGDVPRGGRRPPGAASTRPTARTRSSTGSTRRSTRAPASSSTRPAFTFTSIALLDALKMFPARSSSSTSPTSTAASRSITTPTSRWSRRR